MPDTLRVEYIPLPRAESLLFDRNPKKHDIGAIAESIRRYGFKDPPKFEPALNGGNGGIVEGNGRIETLTWMCKQGQAMPRGIVEVDGDWCIPVLFGVDAESEKAAAAYAIDHNNLVLSGGEFTALDASRMWDLDYIELLTSLGDELPVTVDDEDLALLIEQLGNEHLEDDGRQGDGEPKEIVCECPHCGEKFTKLIG